MSPRRQSFKVSGMDCADEVAILKREVGPLVGGEEYLAFDLLNGKMTVLEGTFSPSSEAILQVIRQTGMSAMTWEDDRPSDSKSGRFWNQFLLMAVGGVLAAIALGVHADAAGGIKAALGSEGMGIVTAAPMAAKILNVCSIIASSWFILPKAWLSARRFRPDMNLLMTVAVLGAAAIGEWFEAATVAFLFAVSLVLESWSIGRARRSVEALMDLTPPTAHVVEGEVSKETPAATVPVGAIFVVKPGERVPLDGRVLQGESALNQAPITGESMPVLKSQGDEVFAGSINGDGTLTLEVTKPAADTLIGRIIRLIGEAHGKRSPSEQWVDRFAQVYTPTIMILAILVAVLPPLFHAPGGWGAWFYRALVLLVIACPCALVISTPVSIVAGLASAARHGVLVKGGLYLEAPARLKAIAFDKTGTLTEGQPRVVEIVPIGSSKPLEVLGIAASMESQSGHPLARAIVTYARGKGVIFAPAEEFKSIQGKGAEAKVLGRPYWLGSHLYLEERGIETPDMHYLLANRAQSGHTVVVLGSHEVVLGVICLADPIRANSKGALTELRKEGIEHLVMLTGDNSGTATVVGGLAGVDAVQAELLPEGKVSAVEFLTGKYGQVAMVGDGVNDAPAMARATLGIAMGAMGSDAAIETADIALMKDDLSRIPWLVRHSRRTLAVIHQNIGFALTVKGVFVLLTITGHASLWSAIAADMGASLLVIFNGLRLLRE